MIRRAHQLLVVDWDYWFNNPRDADNPDGVGNQDFRLYDWGQRESLRYRETIWIGRAAPFLANGLELPGLTGEPLDFWDRLSRQIDKNTRLFYADSNVCAVASPLLTPPRTKFESVWLFDAHHDCGGYKKGQTVSRLLKAGEWSCEDWMVVYAMLGAELHVRYPQWRASAMHLEPKPLVPVDRTVDDGSVPEVMFDRIFVCRSGAWVPPWNGLDEHFNRFIEAAPVKRSHKVCLEESGELSQREFNMETAKRVAELFLKPPGVTSTLISNVPAALGGTQRAVSPRSVG